ncbi:MAG: ion transporter [Pseudomonadota bacterium]
MQTPSRIWQAWLYRQLFAKARHHLSLLNGVIIGLIILTVLLIIAATEPRLAEPYGAQLSVAYTILGGFFMVEFLVRLAVVGANRHYAGFRGRVRYLMTMPAIIDALALLPFVLMVGLEESFVLRLLRLISLGLRLGNFSRTRAFMLRALWSRREELLLCVFGGFLAMVFAATGLFIIEGRTNPDTFGSIPRALWWALITLTTVGYGDAVPTSTAGRIIAGMTAIAGIALIALITSVIASAFGEASHRRRTHKAATRKPSPLLKPRRRPPPSR